MDRHRHQGEGKRDDEHSKDRDLDPAVEDPKGHSLSTDQGVPIADTDNSLRAGARGPTLLEDFHLREKITHFDHERIPERVVHARGSAAHGFFQVYQPMARYTRAKFLQDPAQVTPVFVRFSTVGGSRGSADTVRDVRGFATKFYTEEGNFDLVGNNIPVFFIQDGIKFPDLVHALKPEPDREIPQASSAHDTFWDFISLVPETAHMVMWLLSDRALPRSFRMMEGFGVHTFRFVNDRAESCFVKFHWKPLLGTHSLAWDEAQRLAGLDPDFHRRDLWDAIERRDYPEFELGVQLIPESDEFKYPFDLLDATKLVPEELVPVQRIGKMTLNRNPDNFFAETEQAAFHVGNLIPGIDVTDDPLMQIRLFSYLDTQLLRLGGPNFTEIPINRPLAPVHNQNQDGFMRQKIHRGRANYFPNSIGGGCPMLAAREAGGYVSYPEPVAGRKIRQRSESFHDHFSQARLFWNSLSGPEQRHLVEAGRFELGKVDSREVRNRVIALFSQIDGELARRIGAGIGVAVPARPSPPPQQGGAAAQQGPAGQTPLPERAPALSMAGGGVQGAGVRGRRVAILVASGVDETTIAVVRKALMQAGAQAEIVAPVLGPLKGAVGAELEAERSFLTSGSVLYDAVFVPGGAASVAALRQQDEPLRFVREAFRHCKAIGVVAEGAGLLAEAGVPAGAGVVVAPGGPDLGGFVHGFLQAIAQHRHWEREEPREPAQNKEPA